MILDRVECALLYFGLGPQIAAALKYLAQTDFSRVPNGRQELDGDRLLAIVQRYRTKPAADARWEAHRQYIDVQYVAAGVERMGWFALHDGLKVATPYDPAKDVIFFDAQGQFFDVPAGHFVIFAPSDAHAPGLQGDGDVDEVLKVVVKCRVQTP
jgi:biofilm protein TabA